MKDTFWTMSGESGNKSAIASYPHNRQQSITGNTVRREEAAVAEHTAAVKQRSWLNMVSLFQTNIKLENEEASNQCHIQEAAVSFIYNHFLLIRLI